jgi:hypothetical protein
LGDKFRPATTEMVIAKDRYFDLDAVRTPHKPDHSRQKTGRVDNLATANRAPTRGDAGQDYYNIGNAAGAPPLDWWKIPTTPYKGAHYATWPPELCIKPIKAMCPEKVCRECGEPSRRIVDANRIAEADDSTRTKSHAAANPGLGMKDPPEVGWEYERTTIGWSDCGHNNYRPGMVLDPYAGTGTTLTVATGHSRDATGIDLDPRNAQLALNRVGPMLLKVDYSQKNV